MYVGFDRRKHEDEQELADFERQLRSALQYRDAPVGLKQRVLARARERRQARHGRGWLLQRVAASVLLAGAIGGFAVYRRAEEQRKGEEARQQVMTAFRITSRTLDRVNDRLMDSDK
jgi:hypothetical protein